ncbi:Werner syndrome-like exonuclease [Tanacetum coccineum]|uniref:Werner syndrome-like exonuclease n=1 Tax=Tanacetum coccineum TaxID=301880 RepID=A0ABQ5E3F1_9ASTR
MTPCSINLVTYVSSAFKYLVKYDGKTIKTTVTNQGAVAEEWVSEILLVHSDNKNHVVGLDIKWDDSPDELVRNKCSVLLLCIETKCLILQLLYMDTIPETIKSFLMNSKFTFMGVNEDMSKLVSEYGLHCANTEDIRMIVTKRWLVQFGQHDLEYLVDGMFTLEIKKPGNDERLNKWAARVLNEKQVLYACNLAYVSYKIAHTIIVDKVRH